jgi:hypothetical protein
MNPLSIWLCRRILPHILDRACEARIHRSGEEGTKVNCFVTAVDKGAEPYLIVLGICGSDLDCIEWNGSRYEVERQIPLATLRLSDFSITHYYGLSSVEYRGIADFILNRLTGWPYLKIRIVRLLDHLGQYVFNKKKLYTKQRIELLKFLVDRALDGQAEHNPLDLMSGLYTMRWFLHPQGDQQQNRVEFYLNSLVETGELKHINYKYIVTGKALRTIEEYEEQERKHTENVKMQWRMFWLTVVVAIGTIVQAGLVKLPAVIDMTTK